jgi:hypothetical protein
MTQFRNIYAILAFLLVIFCAGISTAQTIVREAHFSMPFSATCVDTILPAGDYKLSVARVSSSRDLVYRVTFHGFEITKTIIVAKRPGPEVGKASVLVVMQRGMNYSIHELNLPEVDLVLTFTEPRNRILTTQAAKSPTEVPILLALRN